MKIYLLLFLLVCSNLSYAENREHKLWLRDAHKYNEPLFQDLNQSLNIESYRFIKNAGEDGWGDFFRVTKIDTKMILYYGYVYAYNSNKKQMLVSVNLTEDEWDKIVFSINDMNYTKLSSTDDFHVSDAGFTLFESLKDNKYHHIARSYPSCETKKRKLQKFVYARKVIIKVYRKIKKDKNRIKTKFILKKI